MKTKNNKIKTTTLTMVMVFALIGTTGIGAPAFAGAPTECAIPPSNMVAWWPLDESTAPSADIVGGNDGTWNGNPTVVVGEKVVNSTNFDGDDSIAVINDPSLEPTSEVTVDAWVRSDAPAGQWKHIVAKGNQGNQHASYALYTGVTEGLFFYVANATHTKLSPDATNAVWDGNWHHVAGTYNGTHVRLFVDGAEIGTGTPHTGNIDYGLDMSNDLRIGQYPSDGLPLYFTGDIDEVEIFDRALDLKEIQAIYDADSFGKCKTFVEPSMVSGIFHPGENIDKKLTVLEIPEDGPYDVLVEITNSTAPGEECLDALGTDVLTLTNQSATNGIIDTPFMLFYDEKITAMPGSYHCTVEFIANVTTSSNTYSLANQTTWLDVIGSKGYWKNHPDASTLHTPITIGAHEVVDSDEVTNIMKAHKGKFDLDKLAAQLLTAKLNLWAWMGAGATGCIDGNVTAADLLLVDRGYAGIDTGNKLDKSDKKPALSLHSNLDDFNNFGCP